MRDSATWDRLAAEKGADRAAWDEDTPEQTAGHAVRIGRLIDDAPPGRVVDLGCGPGRVLAPLAALFDDREFVGVDVSRRMTAPLRRRMLPRVTVTHPRASTIPVSNAAVVYSTLMFQHVDDWTVRRYIAGTAAALVDGGLFTFQFVIGAGQDGPLAFGRAPEQMVEWCADVRLAATAEPDEHRPTWAWITGQKGTP